MRQKLVEVEEGRYLHLGSIVATIFALDATVNHGQFAACEDNGVKITG